MEKNFEVFFSNRLEILYQNLKISLFGPSTSPFMRRLIVVYGPAMKNWLMLQMAQDSELNVAMGVEFIYFSQVFENLAKTACPEQKKCIPTQIELALAIEKECLEIIRNYRHLELQVQQDWQPLIRYLKLNPHHLSTSLRLSRKTEKRLISLSQHLARLFQDYGRYANQMISEWEMTNCKGWQAHLWRKLFGEKSSWTYSIKLLQQKIIPTSSFSIHFFSVSFIATHEFNFLSQLSNHICLNYYLLSPCAVFWSDIRSDKESLYLQLYWQNKIGSHSSKIVQLEELLRDRNPLLANFGSLGRQMAHQIEESQAKTFSNYVLPQQVQDLNESWEENEDLYFLETGQPLSLLHAIQADLLMMRNPQGLPIFDLEEESNSLQLHVAPNARREIEILYHTLLGLISKNPSISPGDIIVMAPQIADYVPYIQSVFNNKNSLLDCQILDLGMQMQNEIAQGFLQLIKLSESRWNAGDLLQLFEQNSFQRKHQLTTNDYLLIQKWIEQSGIRWGEDGLHRDELLKRWHCQQGMAEETFIGTWDYGLSRLLMGLTTLLDSNSINSLDISPCSSIDFSQSELLEKWIQLLHALRDDLSPLNDRTQMTIEDWTNYFICLLENYFQPDFENEQSIEEYDDLKQQFEILKKSAWCFKESKFCFSSVKTHLLSLLQQRGLTYRENHLQSVRFCSLMPLRSIPAKVIAILGLQEGSYPRIPAYSSLNLMLENKQHDYYPTSTDYDRYLFLEAIHAAQNHFILSYQEYGQYEGKQLQPSLIVEELFSYLDKFYSIQGQLISKICIIKHPFDSFDASYFEENKSLCNFSIHDYANAKTHYKKDKTSSYQFLSHFKLIEDSQENILPSNSQIDIKLLTSVARNPIKFHLNKILEIYLQSEQDRKIKIEEELTISSLDRYVLKQFALREPLDTVLHKAEKEGKLPFGLFKTVAVKKLKEEVKEINERLQKHLIDPSHLFQIEFCMSCKEPIQIEEDYWLFPAVCLQYEEGYSLFITGKLPHVTSKGLLSLSKGSLADVWKIWPQFLLYCHAVKLCPQKWLPQLILAHAAQPKKAFFEDPSIYLKQFVKYYTLCLQNFSPLLPDWLTLILEEDSRGLQDKMRQLFTESFGIYQNEDLKWILNKQQLPNAEDLIACWKAQAQILLKDMMQFWYPAKSEKTALEYEKV